MRRAQIDKGSQPVRNLLSNPSIEQTGAAFTFRTNLVTNPSFETQNGTVNVRVNLATNPSFEAPSGTITVRSNLCRNPSCETDTTGYQTNTGTGGVVVNTRGTDGGMFGQGYRRSAWTTAPTSGGYIEYNIINQSAFQSNTTYTYSAYIRPSMSVTIFPFVSFAQGNTTLGSATGTSVVCPANVWTRVSHTATSNVGTDGAWWDWKVASTMVDGTTIDIDGVLIEATPILNPYFDGATSASGDFAYAWTGTAHASASSQTAPGVTGWSSATSSVKPHQSKSAKTAGSFSLRIPSDTSGNRTAQATFAAAAGKTYTISANMFHDAATARDLRLDYTFQDASDVRIGNYGAGPSSLTASSTWSRKATTTIVAPAGTATIRVYAALYSGTGGENFLVDSFLVEESAIAKTYFDGSFTAATNLALNATVTGSNLSRGSALTDGVITTSNYAQNPDNTNSWVQVDLGGVAVIDTVKVWHYYGDSRSYNGTKTEVSIDGVTWIPVYDSAVSGTYVETAAGKTITFQALAARYIRDWTNGNTVNTGNHYIELQAFASDYTYGWSGSANASTSTQMAPGLVGWNNVNSAILYQTATGAYSGTKCTAFFAHMAVQGGYLGAVPVPAVAGDVFTVSAWVKGPTGAQFHADFDTRTGGSAWSVTQTSAIQTFTGNWQRVSIVGTAGANADAVAFGLKIDGPILGMVYIDAVLVEKTNALNDYFDGSTTQTDYTFAWTGTAHASTSTQGGMRPSGVSNPNPAWRVGVQSSVWSSSGSKSLRVVPTAASQDTFAEFHPMLPVGYTFQAGKTYTVAATRYQPQVLGTTPIYNGCFRGAFGGQEIIFNYVGGAPANAIGVSRAVATFVPPVTGTVAFLRVYAGVAVGNGEVWYDDLFLCEGTYLGDHIDGTKPLSKWDGVVHQSSSVGYPPRLSDLAAKPDVDYSATNSSLTLPDNYGLAEPRTIYTVYLNRSDMVSGTQPDGIVSYGDSDVSDSVANRFMTLRQEYVAGTSNAIKSRRTGGGGPILSTSVPGVNIACWGVNDDGTLFIQNNAGIDVNDNVVMSLPHKKLTIAADSTYHAHIRTLVYRGKHSPEVRQAVARYLGNKYGANVA